MTSTVTADFVTTLDGHVTGPNGPYDMSCIATHGVSSQARAALVKMTEADVVLLGRKSYEGFQGYWPSVADDPHADARDRQFAAWLTDVPKIVFSRTLHSVEWNNSRLATQEPAEVVRELRRQGLVDIRVPSSMSIIRQLLDADEIDALEIAVAPTISGGGARLFQDGMSRSEWITARVLPTDSGAVRITYHRERHQRETK